MDNKKEMLRFLEERRTTRKSSLEKILKIPNRGSRIQIRHQQNRCNNLLVESSFKPVDIVLEDKCNVTETSEEDEIIAIIHEKIQVKF